MKETHIRSLVKAFSWRLSGSFLTTVIVYMITGKAHFALYIGLLEFICKIAFFYLHERLWGLISFGISGESSSSISDHKH